MFSVEATPGATSAVVTAASQANQGLDLGVVRVANGSSAIFVSVGDNPNASVHPRRYVGAWDTFEGIIKQGQRVAIMLAGTDY